MNLATISKVDGPIERYATVNEPFFRELLPRPSQHRFEKGVDLLRRARHGQGLGHTELVHDVGRDQP